MQNAHLLRHALKRSVLIHVSLKSVVLMPNALQETIKQLVPACQSTSLILIPTSGARDMSVYLILIVLLHWPASMRNVQTLASVPDLQIAQLETTEASAPVFLDMKEILMA